MCLKNGCREQKKRAVLTNFLESEVFAELIKKRKSTIFYIFLENISALLNTYDKFEIEIRNGDFWFNGNAFAKQFGYASYILRLCEISSLARLEFSSSKYRKNACLNSCIW